MRKILAILPKLNIQIVSGFSMNFSNCTKNLFRVRTKADESKLIFQIVSLGTLRKTIVDVFERGGGGAVKKQGKHSRKNVFIQLFDYLRCTLSYVA